MKRILTFLVILSLVSTLGVFAQTTGLESIESDVTQGLFGNELDGALTVQETGNKPDFTELDSNYLFGGLGNLNRVMNVAPFTASPTPPVTDLLWLGMYKADKPWSLFMGSYLDGTGATPENVNEVAKTTATGADADGNPVDWIDTEEVYEGQGRLFNWVEKRLQYVQPLGDMNVGLGLSVLLDSDRDPGVLGDEGTAGSGQSYTYTETVYENTATPPAPTVATTHTITQTDKNGNNAQIGVSVPVFLGGSNMLLVPEITYGVTNDSYVYTENYTAPGTNTLGTVNVIDNEITHRSSEVGVSTNLEITREGMGDDDANEMTLGATPRFTMGFGTYESTEKTVATTFPAGGGAGTAGTETVTTTTASVSPLFGAGLNAYASNSFYFEPADIVEFGVEPMAQLSFNWDPSDYRKTTEATVVTTVDGTETVNTTTTWENATVDPVAGTVAAIDQTTSLGLTVSLPTGAVVSPNNLPFEILMGATPQVSTTVTWTSTKEATEKSTDNLATTSTTTFVNADGGTKTRAITYSVSSSHNFGLSFPFADTARLDVQMNGSNLLVFDNLAVQAIFALQ